MLTSGATTTANRICHNPVSRNPGQDHTHAEEAVANYIEIFYNHRRPHQALGYATPVAYRARRVNSTAA